MGVRLPLLPPQMKHLIIIRGPLGIGKTTIAQKLASEINGIHISIDDILAQNHLDQIDDQQGSIPLANFLQANQFIFPQIDQAFSKNQPVIIDGNFYYQPQIENLINHLPSDNIVFTLTAPLEVCLRRDSLRPNPYGKNAATAVYNLVSKFNYGQVIDTSALSIDETVDLIISQINS
jgi:tRNA uridine 5-carbamoylmethylation protein Kti12